MAGRPEPELPPPPVGPLVAIAVGKTKEGESLPAKPGGSLLLQTRLDANIVCHTKLRVSRTAAGKGQYTIAAGGRQAAGSLLVHDNGGSLGGHLCSCSQSDDKHEAVGGVAASSKLCGPDVEACSSERWDGMALVDVGCARTRQAPPRSALGVPAAAAQAEWRGKFGDVAVWVYLLAPSCYN
jgi:hypothetical protein